MKKILFLKSLTLGLLLLRPALASAAEGTSTLTATDAAGTTSFNAAGHWSGGLAPGAGTNFNTSSFGLRTPADGNSYAFGGDSLTLQPGTTSGYSLIYKGTAANNIYTINNFTNAGGLIRSGAGYNNSCTFAGSMVIPPPGGTIQADQSAFIISANLRGSGILTNLNPAPQTYGSVTYSGTNTAFTGEFYLGNNGLLYFTNVYSVPGNPATPNPGQITLGAGSTLLDYVGVTLGNPNGGITLNGNATLNVTATNAGAATTVSEPITDNGAGYVLTKQGAGTLVLSGSNSFGGGLNLVVAQAGSQLDLDSTNALGSGTFTLAASGVGPAILDNTKGTALTLTANNPQSWNNSLTFIGSSSLNLGNGAVTLGEGLTVTVSNNVLTVAQLEDNGAGYSVTKSGSGTLVLDGGGAYYGSTIISNGVLALTGSGSTLTSTNISLVNSNATLDVTGAGGLTLAPSQTLGGSGTVTGALADGSGTIIQPGGSTAGTLSFKGNLTLNGSGSVNYYLSSATTPGGGTNSLILVSGTLTVAGPTPVSFIGLPSPGVYTLFQYGTFAGSVASLTVPSGFAVTNNTGLKAIQLVKIRPPASLVWQGDGAANVWDTDITANWLQSGTNQYFNVGDNVAFTDTGSANPPINLTGVVSPASTTVNAAQTYDFVGSGISTGGLVKNGAGTLILENPNTYPGWTVVNNGILQIGNPNNLGSSGSLGTGAVSNNAALIFDLSAPVTVANPIIGSGTLTQSGSGTTTLTASNSYTGGTTVASGYLAVQNSSALGVSNALTTVDSGGQLFVNLNLDLPAYPLILNGSGPAGDGALHKGGGGSSTLGGAVTLASDTTINLDGNATLNLTSPAGINGLAANANLTLAGDGGAAGNISNSITLGAGSITVAGGTWTVATNNYSGGTFLNGGSFRITTARSLGSLPAVFNPYQVSFSGGALEAATNVVFADGLVGFYLGGNGTLAVDSGATLTISNQINGGGNLYKIDPGTLVLAGSNDFSGTLYLDSSSNTANDGTTVLTTSNAVAGVPVTPGTATIVQSDNNAGFSTLQLNPATGPIILPQEISIDCRNNTNPNLENVTGTNYLLGNLDVYQGGGAIYLRSDAGTLNFTGSLQYQGAIANPRTFTFSGAGNFLVAGPILAATVVTAPVSLQMLGTGTLTLAGQNTYEASTIVSNGVLLLTGSINTTNGVTVAGGDLAGTGVINDNVTIQSGGSLTPGLGNRSIGTLTISSNLVLAGVTSVDINQAAHTSDQVAGLAGITYGGTLAVTNLAGTLAVGDHFTLFSAATAAGNFTTLAGYPGPGLAYAFNPANGVLSVVSGIASNPTNLTATVSGANLVISWPADHQGWILQSQTNTLSQGLATNWVDVAGSSSTNSATFPINVVNPTVFFRLRHP